jgi:hypothetical protein
MAQVILFGGGDAGGLIITAHGIRRIPPFDPGLRLQLRGVSALTQASGQLQGDQDFSALVNKLAHHAVARVGAVVGVLDAENSLIFQDDAGGFSCGSTGKPPIPLPHPVNKVG